MSEAPNRARVVLLGASNLTRGLPVVAGTAQQLFGTPLDIHVVAGHGRSYGCTSFVLVRSLSSVLDSSLWRSISADTDLPTYGLVTDIGNDLMLGMAPDALAGWVDEACRRLRTLNSRIVMTGLPLKRLERLTQPGYLLARSLLFPGNRLSRDAALDRAWRTARLLSEIAARHCLPLVIPGPHWYGADPIHIRRAARAEAWATILRHWHSHPPPPQRVRACPSLARWRRLRTATPDRWWLFGRIPRGRAQPAVRLDDGTTVSFW